MYKNYQNAFVAAFKPFVARPATRGSNLTETHSLQTATKSPFYL